MACPDWHLEAGVRTGTSPEAIGLWARVQWTRVLLLVGESTGDVGKSCRRRSGIRFGNEFSLQVHPLGVLSDRPGPEHVKSPRVRMRRGCLESRTQDLQTVDEGIMGDISQGEELHMHMILPDNTYAEESGGGAQTYVDALAPDGG